MSQRSEIDRTNADHDEEARLRGDVRRLKGYALATSVALLVLALGAFRRADQKRHFGEIDVERLNIVEKDGTPRFIYSNAARFPGLIIHGKEYPHPTRKGAGMLWFNEEGTENGGMGAEGRRGPNGAEADAGLMFDQYDQDQTVGLTYSEHKGRRSAGLNVWDRADVPIQGVVEKMTAIGAMPEGPAKIRAMTEIRESIPSALRFFAGKSADRAAVVQLADAAGRPRLRLLVDSLGTARLDFLDERGKVTSSLPAK